MHVPKTIERTFLSHGMLITHHIQIERSRVPPHPDVSSALREPVSQLFPGGPYVAFSACAADVGRTVNRTWIRGRHGWEHECRLQEDECVWIVRRRKLGQRVDPGINDHYERSIDDQGMAYQMVQAPEWPIPTTVCPRKRGKDRKALR